MKTNHFNLPANCSVISEDEMMYIDGGFELKFNVKTVLAGIAAIAVGAIGLNMFNWATGNRDTNFIQDSMNFGQNFINGSVNAGQSFLDGLLGK